MHKHKKHELVPSISAVITLIHTSIHHTATEFYSIITPSIIHMFSTSLHRKNNINKLNVTFFKL